MGTNGGGGRRPAVCLVGFHYFPNQPQIRRDSEALVEAGFDVSVVVRRRPGQPPRESINGIDVYRLPVEHRRGSWLRYVWEYLLFLLLAFATVSTLHLRKRFRVVEVLNMPDVLVLTALLPKLSGAKVILYILDTMPEIMAAARGLGPRHPIVRLLGLEERLSAGLANRLIVTQEMARRAICSRGVPPGKVSVVLNCPDEKVFSGQLVAPSRAGDAFVVLTHGTMLERWGNQVLMEALPLVAREVPTVRAELFGDGEYLPRLKALAQEKGVADRVRFHGWVPVDELPAHIAGADVGFVGVLFNMALSNKLLEYAAMSLPTVVSRWPTHEHYFPEETAIYYRPGDAEDLAAAILKIYRDPADARRRAERAAELYRGHYRWSLQKAVYLGLYGKLLGDRARPAFHAGMSS